MVLPNFFMVGVARSASTSLAAYFKQHPDICFCRPHEPNFFAFDHEYKRGLDYYKSLYKHYGGEPVIGEKSWRYSCAGVYPAALSRILEVIPSFKAIYVVRDPVKRAVSLWSEMRDGGQGLLDADPNIAIARDPIIIDSSLYNTQIARFEETLGPENVLIVFYEDFVRGPDEYYRTICEFLQISVFQPKTSIKRNVSTDKRTDRPVLEWLRRTWPGDVPVDVEKLR